MDIKKMIATLGIMAVAATSSAIPTPQTPASASDQAPSIGTPNSTNGAFILYNGAQGMSSVDGHYSHMSHMSHSSHMSHRSHCSHTSGFRF